MAEEKSTATLPEPAPDTANDFFVNEVPELSTEKTLLKEQQQPLPMVTEKDHKRSDLETALAAEKAEEKKAAVVLKSSASFKEESNLVGDLQDRERKALDELKQLIQAAIAHNEFSPPPPHSASATDDAAKEESNAEETPKQPAGDAKTEETANRLTDESNAEEAMKAPVEETTAAVEETRPEEGASRTAVEDAEPEEAALKPAAEETEVEDDASEPAAEEPEMEEDASKPTAEEANVEEDAFKTAAEETKAEDATPPPVSAEAGAKLVVADDDGAKTVESIEGTVVPVAAAAPPPAEEAPPAEMEGEEQSSSEAPAALTGPPEEVFIWGAPLLGDERSDTILLKFLRARDFKVKETMTMLKNAVRWREEFGIESLLTEDLGVPELEKVVFMHGTDREGHPVCYNVYGELQSKDLYALAFSDKEKRKRFLRWRIQFLERGIRDLLDLSPGGVSTMVQVIDLKNSIGMAKKELRQALDLLQDNYPEFAAKQIFINVPWWYLAFNRMISPFFTQRTKSKFVFAGPSRSAETLFKYVAPEQVPVQYGGLSKENDPDFTTSDAATEITIKPFMEQSIEIPVSEECLPVWELRVLGWDVSVETEFVPLAEDGYTIIVQKVRKLSPGDGPVIKGSYKVGEAGKVILTVDNTSKKKKLLLYRYKINASTESV